MSWSPDDLGNDKSVSLMNHGHASTMSQDAIPSSKAPVLSSGPQNKSAGPFTTIPTMRPEERSTMSIGVKYDSDFWTTFSNTLNQLQNTDVQFQEGQQRVLGNHYQYGKNCHFLCALFQLETEEKQHVLDFRRLNGNGFTMDNFYQNVRSECAKQDLVDNPDEMESDDEDGFEFSDDESTDNPNLFFLTPNAYLQLNFDPEVVTSWVKRLLPEANSFVEEIDHILGLMAFNAEEPTNLKIIQEEGERAGLISVLKYNLESRKDAFTDAAIVRNSSVLVKIFANNNMLDVNDTKMIDAMIGAMKDWSLGSSKGRWLSLNVSKETVSSLADALWCLFKNGADENYIKQQLSDAPKTISTFLQPTHTNLENAQNFRQHFL